jgi:hypothetical protein
MFPRYELRGEQLHATTPVLNRLADLRAAEQNPQLWQEQVDQLRLHDRFYHPILFSKNMLDGSPTIRMVRRAVGQKLKALDEQRVHTAHGFREDWPGRPVLIAMVRQFVRTAREDKRLPIILLIHDRGYRDHLYQMLGPMMEAERIPYLSTHRLAPDTELANFQSDGHFSDDANRRLAQALRDTIQQHRSN